MYTHGPIYRCVYVFIYTHMYITLSWNNQKQALNIILKLSCRTF